MTQEIAPPAPWRIIFEAQAAIEYLNLSLRYKALTASRANFTHPVVLFPGFGTSERAMFFLGDYLKRIGAEVFDWGIGRNHGYVPDLLKELITQVKTLSAQRSSQLNLVGWSLGGYLAREVARELPDLIHKVVTLGTPVVGGPKYTAVAKLYARWGFDLDAMARDVADRNAVTIDREILAIYSKGDNIVSWQACIDNQSPRIRHEEVQGSHLGLVVNARAFGLTRDFLSAQSH